MRIIIVGCGIGGMSLALSLRQCGLEDVTVFEQADALSEVGAGIQLSANAVRLLQRMGLGPALASFGVLPSGLSMRSWQSGEQILWTDLGDIAEEQFGAPYYHAHRADLHAALTDALGLSQVRLNSCVAEISNDADGVSVTLTSGETCSGDVLIGADGIHSSVRQALIGPGKPRDTGLTALRGLVPAEAVSDLGIPKVSGVWLGPGQSMVHYYVRRGELLNWIGIVPGREGETESWSARGTREEAVERFAGWHADVRNMIERTEAPFQMRMYDREALSTWRDGRVALLGDAAHSMLPFHAQGAAMAIEDAWVLARCLQGAAGEVSAALSRYQSLRLERANWVQAYSRQAEEMFHLSDPDLVKRRDEKLRWNQENYPEGFPPGQIRIYGYDAEAAFLA
jgi:salicylate hydroxylase